ncbi:4071_t:CDS:2 [Gigaspora margarita]|uniref:4071_t:CDS:1 n=1 Tax=Gigaspora margarita TaxID=4874 RepID=A0ABM8W0P0_GIGMA|nr:4071_t:CDS:2 [Gigaspora margarita]
MFTAQPRKIRNYATSACERCKMAKKKCTGKFPCDNCVIRDAECVFSEQKKREPEIYPGLELTNFDITPLILPSLTDFPNNNISAVGVSPIFSEYENTHQHFIGYEDQILSFDNYSDSCINISGINVSEDVNVPESFLNEYDCRN